MNFDNINDIDVDAECEKIMSLSPDTYSKEEYWNQRYIIDAQNHKMFEWYHPWSFFAPKIFKYIKCNGNTLNVGSGNSTLSYDLLNYGAEKVYSIDISSIVINYMKEEYKDNRKLEWVICDCRNLNFPDNFFDFAIDKGTYDAILCSSDGKTDAKSMFKEISRTLKPGSQFVEISTSNQGDLIKAISKSYLHWNQVQNLVINDVSNTIYVNIMEKQK